MKPDLKLIAGGVFTFGYRGGQCTKRGCTATGSRILKISPEGGDMRTTCSEGRCPQRIALDKTYEYRGLCYFHGKVADGLIHDYVDIDGNFVEVSLP